ncbi:hypothetical protein [Phytohabitans rumicis]|uniref:Uncharacterized protein n=1 Tax=Phytohabitans rumicis TaxID=1076125 RepID=A0A6V8LAL8_9ACTN|nr:hypothetical protein [Phytohabitans rumicis]GFJ92660.1 hypothetical protein Prum_063020 [Phytohabitans rumicis]
MTHLYDLLPAVHRVRDAAVDPDAPPLRALLDVLQAPAEQLAEDIAGLYDGWFIETCDEATAMALGELLGVRPLNAVPGIAGPRGYVANTMAYRRRKGTAAVVEQLALDVTGWPARAVELFERLATTQQLNHVRPAARAWATVRGTSTVESPFEPSAHTAEARATGYGIRTIRVFLWRLAAFPVVGGTARPLTDPPDGRYHVNPLGLDAPLFNPGRREGEITHLARERDVPVALRRRPLHDELNALRDGTGDPVWFGVDPVLRLVLDGTEVTPTALSICDLSTWRRPTAPGIRAAVDPVLGRIALPTGVVPDLVQVGYAYGFSGRVGAGPYEKGGGPADATWTTTVGAGGTHATIGAAVLDWNAQPAGTVGVIEFVDSASYREDVTVAVPAGSRLHLVADDAYPHLRGSLTVTGDLAVSGLLIEGDLTASGARALAVRHSTVRGTLSAATPATDNLRVTVERSITAGVAVTGTADVRIAGSVVDGDLDAADADVDLDSVTVLGATAARTLSASDCLFTEPLGVARRQAGCLRFSFVPPGSLTPRRHRCVSEPPPSFTSKRYGDPGFAQLADDGPLSTGAADGAEMGAFRHLRQPQRMANLRTALDEYLPAGLTAGTVRVT